jgi:hypothetical protein
MEQTKKLNNGDRAIKWTDLTKVLKVGDTVYSSLHGEGKIVSIKIPHEYPIDADFNGTIYRFTRNGFYYNIDKYPCITNIPFNPLTDPFPLPRFEPIVGEWYAFWDNNETGFTVFRFKEVGDRYVTMNGYRYLYCAPIEEALKLLQSKVPPNEHS